MDTLSLTIDIDPTDDDGAPEPLPSSVRRYAIRRADGTYESRDLAWTSALLDELAAVGSPDADPALRARVGGRLRQLLHGTAWSEREAELVAAAKADRPIDVTVCSDAPEILSLPWELLTLRDSGQHVGELPSCLVRYEWAGSATAAPVPEPPEAGGRIVLGWSAAGGAVPAAELVRGIAEEAGQGGHPFDPSRDVVPCATPAALAAALAAAPAAVLQLVFRAGPEGLLWEPAAPDTTGQRVTPDGLRQLLAPHLGTLRLVIVTVCGAAPDGNVGRSSLTGLAQALHRLGVPAVVGSRVLLSAAACVLLTRTLYRQLLVELSSLEAALRAARRRLADALPAEDWAAVQFYGRARDGDDHRPIVVRPYRGLLAFRQEHARLFFGLDAEIDEAVAKLDRLSGEGRPRLLIVAGASGTGKSSLVLAGVVPALQRRSPGTLTVVTLRPRDGLRQIEDALAARPSAQTSLLLVVDQFEEIFTDVDDAGARQAFAQRMWALAKDPAVVGVIATVRIDYLGRCGELALLPGELYLDQVAYDGAHRVFSRRVTRPKLREMIVRPAAAVGLLLDDGLVAQMLKDCGDEPGALPLLQYALDQLYMARTPEGSRYRMTWAAYERLGGVTGALARRADAILAGFDPIQQRAARRVILQLVEMREELALDTRRRLAKDRLRIGAPAEAAVAESVLATLVRERLLVINTDGSAAPEAAASRPGASLVVELAHEQLVRSWGTLREWLNQDRKRMLELAPLKRWTESAGPGYLLRGAELAQAQGLLAKYAAELDGPERALIERSIAAERRRRRLGRLTVAAVCVTALAMAALARTALLERREAQASERAARRQAVQTRDALLISGARALASSHDATQASQLLTEVEHPESARGFLDLGRALLDQGVARAVIADSGPVEKIVFSPDGELLLALAPSRLRLVATTNPGRVVDLPAVAGDVVTVAFAPNGDEIRAVNSEGTLYRYSLATGRHAVVGFTQRKLGFASVTAAAFTGDGERLLALSDGAARLCAVAGSGACAGPADAPQGLTALGLCSDSRRAALGTRDGRVVSWDLVAGSVVQPIGSNPPDVRILAFSPDCKHLVCQAGEQPAQVWDLGGSGKSVELSEDANPVSASWSSTGRQILIRSTEEAVHVFDLSGSQRILSHLGPGRGLIGASFDRLGERVVTTTRDGRVQIWEPERDSELPKRELLGHQDSVGAAVFSPDDRWIASGSDDGTVRLWAVDGSGSRWMIYSPSARISAVALTHDGGLAALAGEDGVLRIWRLGERRPWRELRGLGVPSALAFGPDGRSLLSGWQSGVVRAFDIETGAQTRELTGHRGVVHSMVLAADGHSLLTVSADGTARVWSLDGAGRSTVLAGHGGPVLQAAFSSDGKRAVTASADATARVWLLDGSGRFHKLSGHGKPVLFAAFLPGDREVLTVSEDHSIRRWNADSDGPGQVLPAQTYGAKPFALIPDGPLLLGGGSRAVTMMSPDREERRDLIGGITDDSVPVAVQLSGDGRLAIVGWSDGTADVWPLTAGALQRFLRTASLVCVAPSEREQHLGEPPAEAQARYEACLASRRQALADP